MNRRFSLILVATIVLASCGASDNSAEDPGAVGPVKNAALPRATTTVPVNRSSTTTKPAATTTTKAPAATTTVATVPSTGPNACQAQGPCKVGQTGPAGGVVFYAAPTPQTWGQFMEVRPEIFEQINADTCNLDAYNTYAAGKVGDGIKQTAAVVAACAKDGKPAAAGSYAKVNAYSQNGYGSWFIPAKDELQALIDSKVVSFSTDRDLTSGTWVNKPSSATSRSFDVLYGLKKEVLAGTAPYSRGGTVRTVEVMSDGTQTYGNPNNRWGWIYIARAFGPKS